MKIGDHIGPDGEFRGPDTKQVEIGRDEAEMILMFIGTAGFNIASDERWLARLLDVTKKLAWANTKYAADLVTRLGVCLRTSRGVL